jgi:polysaccharide pyruvyl transferase WcaK-like protein
MLVDECPEALAYICGSDAVWAADVYFKAPAYLLDFVPDKVKKISYAPSFGKGKLENYQVPIFKKHLKTFDAVSVREQSGLEIIRSATNVKALRVLDPTFLLEDYEEIIDLSAVPEGPYVLVYRLSQKADLSRKTRDLIAELSGRLGIKVINITPDSDESLDCESEDMLPTPGQFLGLIKSATYVLTNSFHGAVFSLLFEKKFVCVPRDDAANKKNLRMVELLNLVGLNSRFCGKLEEIEMVSETLTAEYSTCDVRSKLDNSLESSRNFLINELR